MVGIDYEVDDGDNDDEARRPAMDDVAELAGGAPSSVSRLVGSRPTRRQ